ncbi:MAG: Crp/Fnr family transcriptional regulator [Chromatiales bacterium]|nr:Crp/Fnr family transcriptional regulator [Chromatiales bacterium]
MSSGYLLKDVTLFGGLADADLNVIADLAVQRAFPRNAVVISRDDDSDSLYVIVSGRARVLIADDEGREAVLGTLDAGDSFGDLALLDPAPRVATVVTLEPAEMLVITRADFLRWLDARPGIALNLLRTLARRVRALAENVGSLALLDVYGRTARLLLNQAQEENGLMITPRLTHQEIASMVGASREMVTRILSDLRAGGYIEVEDKRIIVKERLPKRW